MSGQTKFTKDGAQTPCPDVCEGVKCLKGRSTRCANDFNMHLVREALKNQA